MCLSVFDGISLELRARALTVSKRSSLAPRRALFLVYDSCDGELTIGSRLPQHRSSMRCAVSGSENTLACSYLIRTDLNQGNSISVIETMRDRCVQCSSLVQWRTRGTRRWVLIAR